MAAAVAVTGADTTTLEGSLLLRVAFLGSTAATTWLAYVALTVLPKVTVTR